MRIASARTLLPAVDPRWAVADHTLPYPLLVLMYHGLHEGRDDAGHFDSRYSVRPAQFEAQMALIGRERRRVVAAPGEAADTGVGPGAMPALLISFDDGDISNARLALPCLLRHRLPAVFFLSSEHLDQPGWLASTQVQELAETGMRIGSHGASHRFLSALDLLGLERELVDSRDVLQGASGRRVNWLALPGGRGAEREYATARRLGFSEVFGSVPGINRVPARGLPLQRVAITRDLDLASFAQILTWRGPAVRRLCWRHRLLQLPRAVLGDRRYDLLRNRLAS